MPSTMSYHNMDLVSTPVKRPNTKHPELQHVQLQTPQDIMSQLQNVPSTKMSQLQNDLSYKLSKLRKSQILNTKPQLLFFEFGGYTYKNSQDIHPTYKLLIYKTSQL
jgi:hypothetical protein